MIPRELRPIHGPHRCRRAAYAVMVAVPALISLAAIAAAQKAPSVAPGITRPAADSCGAKVKGLEAYSAHPDPKGKVTKFTEQEVNSYLALDLSSKYSPSLKSVTFEFDEAGLQGSAVIDFDQLGVNSKKFATKLFAGMFSGIHSLSVRGKMITGGGKATFELQEARFDNSPLPNFIVSEIITTVGRKQRPPFDPMKPSQMPYGIDRVEFHKDYIVVYQ